MTKKVSTRFLKTPMARTTLGWFNLLVESVLAGKSIWDSQEDLHLVVEFVFTIGTSAFESDESCVVPRSFVYLGRDSIFENDFISFYCFREGLTFPNLPEPSSSCTTIFFSMGTANS